MRATDIDRAAGLIRDGKLVAFPTETVYGLGANALDADAVDRIYRVKGRPRTSPLIVHVSSIEMARALVTTWPAEAEKLVRRYWPGPLTLVLPKSREIPDGVTAGLPTVGLRMPAHEVALELIQKAGVPIAGPSANRFMRLSPTTAEHVREEFGDRVEMVLEGGSSRVGVESTILSLAGGKAVLLRPGMVSKEEIEALIGPVEMAGAVKGGQAHPAPGMHKRHYSPSTPLYLVPAGELLPEGRGAWVWYRRRAQTGTCVEMPADPHGYAAALYETLHHLDAGGWDWIAVEQPPGEPEWAAVLDRLRRAATRDGEE